MEHWEKVGVEEAGQQSSIPIFQTIDAVKKYDKEET